MNALPGRRIVEIDVLAKELVCVDCSELLHLKFIVDETRCGLGSFLYIQCSCGVINKVPTGKTSKAKHGPSIFTINVKASAAMLHSGIGPTKLMDLLSVMNIPPPSTKTIKKRERDVGPVIESVAKKTVFKTFQLQEQNIQMVSLPKRMLVGRRDQVVVHTTPCQGIHLYM